MNKIKGMHMLIKINTGTTELPVWTTVGGQRGATLNRSAETLETTSKESNEYKEFEQGFKEWSLEADGMLIEGDTGYAALETAYLNAEKVLVQLGSPSGTILGGLAIITDFPLEAPYDDMVSYSISLQGSGVLEEITA